MSKKLCKIAIIAAMAENRVIGFKNKLPWNLPKDMERFRKLTMGHTVIMGRKTYESIEEKLGTALPGRINIILSRQLNFKGQDCTICHSLREAITVAPTKKIFIIGGAEIFNQAMEAFKEIRQLYLTVIYAKPEGDAFFPEIGMEWVMKKCKHCFPDKYNPHTYSFMLFER